jgi:hypothetical protein
MMKRARERGQALVEYVLIYAGVITPVLFALIFTAQLLWIWHSVVEFTRDGARYAATHCWQGSGENVAAYMRTHVPPMVDMEQFQGGQAEITVQYYGRNAETGDLQEFACDGGECSAACVPDAVTVRVRNYEFRRFVNYLGLPPIRIPDFYTTVPMESAGCDPDSSSCLP